MKKNIIETVLFVKDDQVLDCLIGLLSKFNSVSIIACLKDSFAVTEYLNHHKTNVIFAETDFLDTCLTSQKPPFLIAICENVNIKSIKKMLQSGINDILFLPTTENNVRGIMSKIMNIYCTHSIEPIRDPYYLSEPEAKYNEDLRYSTDAKSKSIFFNGGTKNNSLRIQLDELSYIKRHEHQLNLYYENGVLHSVNTSLKKIYTKLPKDKFQKINQSVIVNIDKVTRIGKQNKVIIGDEAFTITRSFIKPFKKLLDLK